MCINTCSCVFSTAAHCDFEADACGWHEAASSDGFDWVRSSPQVSSTDQQYKAPPRDHSTNTSTGKQIHTAFIPQVKTLTICVFYLCFIYSVSRF